MSQMTRIRITPEQGFKSKECLEEALMIHGLSSKYNIIKEGDKYQLSAIISRRTRRQLEKGESYRKRLEK